MDWLKSIAPVLSTLLTGTPLAGMAATMIASKLGMPESTVEAVTTALKGNALTSEQITALKLAENDMTKFMADNEIKLEEISAGDRKDARNMQIAVNSHMPAVLSMIVTCGFFGLLVGMMFGWLKTSDSQALLLLLGSLATAWTGVMGFWFGTTAGSQKKTEIIAQADAIK